MQNWILSKLSNMNNLMDMNNTLYMEPPTNNKNNSNKMINNVINNKLVSEESIDPNIQITPKRKLGKVLAERIKDYLLI